MTFRKQWPQKRTEYPTSNRGKSQKQYFAAKTTADRAHATTRGRQSPTTSTPPQPHDLVRPAHRGRPIPAVPPAHGRAGLDAARPAWSPGLPRDGILPAVPGRGAGGLLRAPCATTTPIRY